MAFVSYAKAVFGVLVLEGLRAGVWTGVHRGADLIAPETPLPALEGQPSTLSTFSVCPMHAQVQW